MALKVHTISVKATGHVLAACTLEEGRNRAAMLRQLVGKELKLSGSAENADELQHLVTLQPEQLQFDAVPDDPFASRVMVTPLAFSLKRSLTNPGDVSLLLPSAIENSSGELKFGSKKARHLIVIVNDQMKFDSSFEEEVFTLPTLETDDLLIVFAEGFAPLFEKQP